ncbi:hypothetical protein QP888_04210, partial [Corynebacterium sp. MSK297]|nr:hypothetical protein [Corynebacterium sp. MSK297]
MSKIREISREGRTVITAVIAALAVIFTMIVVPSGKADAAQPTDFQPNYELGGEPTKTSHGTPWGSLTWAGPYNEEFGFDPAISQGNANNTAGWAWCIDPMKKYPSSGNILYSKDNAVKLDIHPEYRDAVIRLAKKWQEAIKNGDKNAAATYVVYMIAFVGVDQQQRNVAALTINGQNPGFENPYHDQNFPAFKGSEQEFTELTGFEIESTQNPGPPEPGPGAGGPRFKKVAEIPAQPSEDFITMVPPSGGQHQSYQRVLPPDQPGLSEEEKQPEKNPSISTNADFADGATQVVAGATVVDTVD